MRTPVLVALAATPLFLLSACGSSSSATATSGGATSPGPASGSGLHVASTSLGKVLVDASGRTVYMFTADSSGHSTCDAACLQYWPAVAPGHAASTVTAKVASTATTSGSTIATVAGWPVYTFIQDQQPGDVTGQGLSKFGGIWYAVSPSGQPVKSPAGASGSTPPSGRGY
jgi:predicted lipoprotein with Yx(FWY)xxD motif